MACFFDSVLCSTFCSCWDSCLWFPMPSSCCPYPSLCSVSVSISCDAHATSSSSPPLPWVLIWALSLLEGSLKQLGVNSLHIEEVAHSRWVASGQHVVRTGPCVSRSFLQPVWTICQSESCLAASVQGAVLAHHLVCRLGVLSICRLCVLSPGLLLV